MPEMPPSDLSWVAAVHRTRDDFTPEGTAVVIDANRVLTSAHVTAGLPDVWVAFPMCDDPLADRRRVTAVRAAPHPMADLAVLELDEPVPASVVAAPLRCPEPRYLRGKAWWAFGFAGGDPRGNTADGVIGDLQGYGWLRLDAGSRYPVEPGFSGSGLWCPDYDAVVGVVGEANDRGDGRAIALHQADGYLPAEKIRLLAQWTVAAADDVAKAAWGWSLAADREADRHWGPRARGVSVAAEPGHRFRGRVVALTEIVGWLGRPVPDRRVLVVTGSPGVGKSAVLGRVVATADAAVRAMLPADDDAPRAEVGSVACAVHAKGKTALDVAMEIARAASAPIPERVDDLVPGLRSVLAERAGARFNLVVDALDEASDPDQARTIVTRIVLPIATTCANVGAQVLVGTRRADDAGPLLDVFGTAAVTIDLDEARYFALDDLVAYTLATLQLRGAERPGNPYEARQVAEPVARRIAEIAEPNFLVAALVARTHGLYDDRPVAVADIAFTPDVAMVLDAFLDRVAAVGEASSRQALTALAVAEAPGFTPELWQQAVNALYGIEISVSQLRQFAAGSAANFLVESSGGVTSYRLFHQALSDALRAARSRVAEPADDEAALTCTLLEYGAQIGWGRAPEYLFRSLPGHAARAGMVDALLADVEYVLHADLRRLVPAADQAQTAAGAETAHMLRRTPRALHAEPAERLALLTVTEALDTVRTAFRSHTSAAEPPYRGRWASVSRRTERALLEGHASLVNATCAVRVNGRELLASGSTDGTVRVWDPASGGTERVLKGHTGGVWSVCEVQVASRTTLASGGGDGTVRVWDPTFSGAKRVLRGHTGAVSAVCDVQVRGRRLLASASTDGTVRLWDLITGATEWVLEAHTGAVNAVCGVWAGGLELLVSAGADGTMRVWDPDSGVIVRVLNGRAGGVNAVCAVQVGGRDLLASASNDRMVRLWDPATGVVERVLAGHTYGVNAVCAMRLDGRELLASAGEDGTVRLWDAATGSLESVVAGHADRVWMAVCAVSSGSRELLASAGADGSVWLWDPVARPHKRVLAGHVGRVRSVCAVWSGGRELLVSAGDDATLRVWNPVGVGTERVLTGHSHGVGAVCAVRVGGRDLLASASSDWTVRIWDLATGEVERVLVGHTHGLNAVCAVAVGGRQLLASAGVDATVRVWDPATGEVERVLAGHSYAVSALCAVRVGSRELLASAGADGMVRVWGPVSGDVVQVLAGHAGRVWSVCAVRVGGRELLASAGGDGTVRLWDPATGVLAANVATGTSVMAVTPFGTQSLFLGLESGVLAVDLGDALLRQLHP